MTRISEFNATTHAGEALHVVSMENHDADSAFALAFVADELPRVVHWGRPLTQPRTLVSAVDALRPQRGLRRARRDHMAERAAHAGRGMDR